MAIQWQHSVEEGRRLAAERRSLLFLDFVKTPG
jgi:hypothetical protein